MVKQSKYIRDEYGEKELTISERTRRLRKKKPSKKQLAQRNKFKKVAKKCKKTKNYRSCMKRELKK